MDQAAISTSGVKKADATVQTQSNGLTIEQDNVKKRLEQENMPGSIKHLYLLSAYSGQILIYSTVKGKVTSSGKRLTPSTVEVSSGSNLYNGFNVKFNGSEQYTSEVLGDDGTYGSSIEYLYWWDIKGVQHQQYITGGMILHISDKPMTFGRVTTTAEIEVKASSK